MQEDRRWDRSRSWLPCELLVFTRRMVCVSAVNLPKIDPFYSVESWYRDYAAYCGLAEDGTKISAMVAQLGTKKPVLRKIVGNAKASDVPDSECAPPKWQRDPTRVTFEPAGREALSFEVRGHSADLAETSEKNDGGTQ